MIIATTHELLAYVADLIETVERYGGTVLPPYDAPDVALEQDGDDVVYEIGARLPADRRSRDVDLILSERWAPQGTDVYALSEYGYELRDNELDYRRALHRHNLDYFLRTYDVATHEHCEATMGHQVCCHYAGPPLSGAIDGFLRLYAVWLAGTKPDCSQLACLG